MLEFQTINLNCGSFRLKNVQLFSFKVIWEREVRKQEALRRKAFYLSSIKITVHLVFKSLRFKGVLNFLTILS